MTKILGMPFVNIISTGDIIIFIAIIVLGLFIASENDRKK